MLVVQEVAQGAPGSGGDGGGRVQRYFDSSHVRSPLTDGKGLGGPAQVHLEPYRSLVAERAILHHGVRPGSVRPPDPGRVVHPYLRHGSGRLPLGGDDHVRILALVADGVIREDLGRLVRRRAKVAPAAPAAAVVRFGIQHSVVPDAGADDAAVVHHLARPVGQVLFVDLAGVSAGVAVVIAPGKAVDAFSLGLWVGYEDVLLVLRCFAKWRRRR
mmetsp:Transcript_18354/g.29724  ORF Transcript_18354/g.29724 Transcript_18354/m.29724 type:complete len:215 (-) Transcript_18354:369-1013(-)